MSEPCGSYFSFVLNHLITKKYAHTLETFKNNNTPGFL